MSATEDANERLMREYLTAWNDHDPETVVSFLSEDCEQYGRDELRAICRDWFRAFPDLTHEVEELVADGDWVLGRATLRGTHEDTFMGVPATGTEIAVADHFSTRFADCRIVEHHATADTAALLEQLGVAIPPDRTAAENEALVRRYFDALNDRDRAAFRETLADEFTYGDVDGPEEMVENEWRWLTAMDLTWDVHAVHATDEFVTARVRARGTHEGEIMGLEPTGESFEVTALTVCRVEDGTVAEWWSEWDFADLLDQLGVVDVPLYDD